MVERALHLIGEGELSKAMHLLSSSGLGNLSDARIVEQLRSKHPARKEELPQQLDTAMPYARVTVELGPTLRALRRHAGTGVSGFRNEYLAALTEDFADARAQQAVPLLEAFAEAYANAELPHWFYVAFTTVKQMAPIKQAGATPDAAPDVRPISIGECLRRAIDASVATQYRDAFREHLWPQQVAVGVSGGLSLLALGIELTLELCPQWVVVKLDLRNAYNELKRAALVARLNEVEGLRDLVPLTWATYLGSPEVYFAGNGVVPSGYLSAEGVHQGGPLSSAQFCVAIHPEVCLLDAELRSYGGSARFDMDDGYAVGPAEQVFPAILRFAARAHALGLDLQLHKCKCFSPATDLHTHPSRPPNVVVGELPLPGGSARGIVVSGVPLGEVRFVEAHLAGVVDDTMSKINQITTTLRDRHSQALWSLAYHCMQSKFHYWLQHCHPDAVQAAAERFDAGLLDVVRLCVGDGVATDELVLRRLRLPARMYGGGLRSCAHLAPAAFIGTLCRVVPLLADGRDTDGTAAPGFMPVLTQALGIPADTAASPLQHLQAFLSTRSRLADSLRRAWEGVDREGGRNAENTVASRVEMSYQYDISAQKLLTRWREKALFQALDTELRALPSTDMRKAAWLNLDRFSTVWVPAWPTQELQFSSPEFREVATFYFGLPSPACAPRAGQNIGNLRQTLDPFGVRLAAASLPGDGWRKQHDALKWRLLQDAQEMQLRLRGEVFGLFADCIPQGGREAVGRVSTRKRQGLVPDFLTHAAIDGAERPLLLELKTLHYAPSTYPPSEERCGAVQRRARLLPGEYAAKARQVDQRYCATPRGNVGPVEARLNTYEPVRGIVFGSWGEASGVTEQLLGAMARTGAIAHWQRMRCLDPAQAIGILAWMLRRRWGLTALRENARLRLDRLEYVGRGAVAAAVRRQHAQDREAARRRAAASSLLSGPRARFAARP